MSHTPIKLRGSQWALVCDPKDGRLANLPGLRTNEDGGRVEGLIDAVAAATVRLGGEAPKKLVPHEFVRVAAEQHDPLLRSYQRSGVAFLLATLRSVGAALLCDDVGLGKTRQAIAAASAIGGRVVIVCPAYVRMGWEKELLAYGHTDVAVLAPVTNKAGQAHWDKAPDAKWVITSFEMADRLLPLFSSKAPSTLIIDEAHLLRGRETKRSRAVAELAAVSAHKLAMTATPMWSRPRDFWKLLNVLFGSRFGNKWDFDQAYCGASINEYGGWVNKAATLTEELRLRLSYYMVRREKRDVLKEMPRLGRQVVWLDGDAHAEATFQRAMLHRQPGMLQEALGATLDAKKEAAVQYAAQAKRFLLFTWLRKDAHEIAARLTSDECPVVCITGDMPAVQRQAAVALARSKSCGVVATIDSAGTGLDGLQHCASTVIFHALDYTPLKLLQAEGRLDRLGQTEPVTAIYLACRNSADTLVVQNVVEKLSAAQAVMGQGGELKEELGAVNEEQALAALYAGMEDTNEMEG